MSWTWETRRSRSALSFSARYIASAVVASIVNVWKGSTISTGNGLNLVENALSDRGSCDPPLSIHAAWVRDGLLERRNELSRRPLQALVVSDEHRPRGSLHQI